MKKDKFSGLCPEPRELLKKLDQNFAVWWLGSKERVKGLRPLRGFGGGAPKVLLFMFLALFFVIAMPLTVHARIGDMGFFGGISQGRRLPHTTETIIFQQGNGRNTRATTLDVNYQELVFLLGRPLQFDGVMTITNNAPAHIANSATLYNAPANLPRSGVFTKRFLVQPTDGTAEDIRIDRNMNFNVEFRVAGNNVIYTYRIVRASWRETITTPDGDFVLDNMRSHFGASVIEDRTPGVNYYRGNVWARLYFIGPDDVLVIVEQEGEFHGFYSAWAATETHRTNVSIWHGDTWALNYQIRPSVTVNNVMRWAQNEPTAISFAGNFQEVMQTFAGLRYDIFHPVPHFMWDEPLTGASSLHHPNSFEQLPAANLDFLRGNAAEDDIHRLFAMEVLTGPPTNFVPGQAITRGQFMTALARAIRLPTADPPRVTRNREPEPLFTDVTVHRPEFRYIEAVVREGVAQGRADGSFHFDYGITRQEAFVTIVRALGLETMGMYPTVASPFADSDAIARWAIREVNVAYTLGIIAPDENGNIRPADSMSKGEAARLLNRLIDYMRTGLANDYADQIVNIAR
ncbi:MAG: S-layer homology domain-containing protein [Defluviitaleaceae bacterium]|nr:S-layer homology domain-containing protein [Defluviitaleaceae bacterium]MCL2240739.1 S-layer homology domain-containing protein [Defluviitaleaceae bacterium]